MCTYLCLYVLNVIILSTSFDVQGGFQLRVSVWDNDNDADDLIDRIFAEMDLEVSDVFTAPTAYTGVNDAGTMTMSFNVACAKNYYGSNCRTFCRPTDDSTGHYTCDDTGGRVCLPGWMDVSTSCLTRESVVMIIAPHVHSDRVQTTPVVMHQTQAMVLE